MVESEFEAPFILDNLRGSVQEKKRGKYDCGFLFNRHRFDELSSKHHVCLKCGCLEVKDFYETIVPSEHPFGLPQQLTVSEWVPWTKTREEFFEQAKRQAEIEERVYPKLWVNFNSMNLSLCGGNRFLFELSNALVDRGYNVSITHCGLKSYKNWFHPIKAKVFECGVNIFGRVLNKANVRRIDLSKQQTTLTRSIPNCDVNVATFWATAKPTFDSRVGKPFYLVQHYEPLFYKDPLHRKLAENSYRYPLTKLCVSGWLKEKVEGLFIGNGINLEKFKRIRDILKVENSVLLSYRSPSWKNTRYFHELSRLLTQKGYTVFSTCENVSDQQMVELYNKAERFVNLSDLEGFGYQPLEAWHCGCAVASTPCSEYLNEDNCEVLDRLNVDYVAKKVIGMDVSHLAKEGFKMSEKYDFAKVVDRFEEAIA